MVVSFAEAIRLATEKLLTSDSRVHVFGLGANYPRGLDGTMGDLAERFPARIHDTPASEAAVTAAAVGAAACGLRPIVHHGRLEFSLYASDAILAQAACWNYMFGGSYPCPLVIRIAIGRQLANGSQHTRVHRSLFAVPGLKVVAPSTPQAAYSLLLAAMDDPDPVIYLESRWLYKIRGPAEERPCELGKAQIVRKGRDVTIVGVGEMLLEALWAAEDLATYGILAEVIDPVSIYPVDYETIRASTEKTGTLIVVDADHAEYSIGRDIRSQIVAHSILINPPSVPCPTAPSLTAGFYPTSDDIVLAACRLLETPAPRREPRTFAQLHHAPTDDLTPLLESVYGPATP